MRFGDKVRKYRLERGLDIEELAKLTGLSESAIRLYEYNLRNPLPVSKTALARVFKIEPNMLDDDKEEIK